MAQPTLFPYRIVDLGPLGFDADENAIGTFDINERHQVAYGREVGAATRPHVWLPFEDPAYHASLNAGVNDLLSLFPIPGFTVGVAFDINDQGIVVGQVGGIERGVAGSRAAWWNLQTGTRGLISPPSGSGAFSDWCRAVAVDEASPPTILIETFREDRCRPDCEDPQAPLAFHVSTAAVTLPGSSVGTTFSGIDCDPSAGGRDIWSSSAGVTVVGFSDWIELEISCIRFAPNCESLTNAIVIDASSVPVFLPDADVSPPDQSRGSEARAVSPGGAMVGWAFADDDGFCRRGAAFWPSATTFIDLHAASGLDDNAAGTQFSVAQGIADDAGSLIVGFDPGADLPFLWEADGASSWVVHELDATNLDLTSCANAFPQQGHDISTRGWIVGTGVGPGGDHAYVLVPPRVECNADLDGDWDVDFDDLLLLLSNFGATSPTLCQFVPLDLDGDGEVTFLDLLVLIAGWCPNGMDSEGIPQTLQDCIDKFGFDPLALEACIENLPTP